MISFKEKYVSNGPTGLTSNAAEDNVLRTGYPTGQSGLRKEMHAYFTDPFESDWKKKTGMLWQEWKS